MVKSLHAYCVKSTAYHANIVFDLLIFQAFGSPGGLKRLFSTEFVVGFLQYVISIEERPLTCLSSTTIMAETFCLIASMISMALAPIFVTSSAKAIHDMAIDRDSILVRQWMGRGRMAGDQHGFVTSAGWPTNEDRLGGDALSIAFWNVDGRVMGMDYAKHRRVNPGEFADTRVLTHSKERPAYIMVAPQGDNMVCHAGLGLTAPDGFKGMIWGDVIAASGKVMFFQSPVQDRGWSGISALCMDGRSSKVEEGRIRAASRVQH